MFSQKIKEEKILRNFYLFCLRKLIRTYLIKLCEDTPWVHMFDECCFSFHFSKKIRTILHLMLNTSFLFLSLKQRILIEEEGSAQLTILHELVYHQHYLFFTKQAALMRRSTVLSLPLQLEFIGKGSVYLLLTVDSFNIMFSSINCKQY
jgi:hypothetical protein